MQITERFLRCKDKKTIQIAQPFGALCAKKNGVPCVRFRPGGGVRPVDPRKKIWTGCCLLEINLVPLSRLSIN